MSAKLDIQNCIYLWVTTEFPSIPFVFQYQNSPVANAGQLFGVINVISSASIAQDEAKYYYNDFPADNVTENVGGPRKIMSSLHLFRTGAFDTLAQLKASLRRQATTDLLWTNGLSFIESSDIRDFSEVVSAEWEERYQMDVMFYTNSQYSSIINRINNVPLAGYIDGELKINVTLPPL